MIYCVAGHRFVANVPPGLAAQMENYAPFACDGLAGSEGNGDLPLFRLDVTWGDEAPVAYSEQMRQEDDGQQIVCGRVTGQEAGGTLFKFVFGLKTAGWLVCSDDYATARLILTGWQAKPAFDSAVMVLYALAAAPCGTALFHASAVCLDGRGYMFLGKSGTGKSTHSMLWIENVKGSSLFNDDNPVVRVMPDGSVRVFGTPWSGKTPCYMNVSHELAAVVRLSQAPFNRIRRMEGVAAYAAIVPSVSGTRWNSRIADGLHDTENAIAKSVPVWHLECLPNAEAALLCSDRVAWKPDCG